MIHIQTVELTSSQSSITFSSIPQDYDDLKILVSARTDRSDVVDILSISVNGGGTFDGQLLRGDGSSVVANAFASSTIGYIGAASTTSNTFNNNSIYIPNYTKSQATVMSSDGVFESNTTSGPRQAIFASKETAAAAVTSLEFGAIGNFVTGTVASLYGVTAGGSGTVTTA